MEKTIVIIGAVLTVLGLIGMSVNFVPNHDGELAITGAIIFASGVIAKAISSQKT
ncbi:hypothetical protein P4B35_15025 [Pontiellaceae bacterium B12227]|nr:hypothetical protein [Pontiellaceae bacterium B12227]